MQTHEMIFQAERLMETVRDLSAISGPRPPTSRGERRAADYVRDALRGIGLLEVEEQFFSSPESAGALAAPYLALGAVAPLLPGRAGKLAGAAALGVGLRGFRDLLLGEPPSFAALLSQGVSQNIIARVPADIDVRHRLFLVAHLDTGKQRLLTRMPVPPLTRSFITLGISLAAASALTMLVDAVNGKRRPSKLHLLAASISAVGLAGLLNDERQAAAAGANDNASGVAVLLALARALYARPLPYTEVTLLFTGCSEAGNFGLEHYLTKHAPPRHNSTWINVERVGAGRLGYVSRHGLSPWSAYRPGPRVTALARRIAGENPWLGVKGRDMLLVDEVASLARRGYEAIGIVGYDDQGQSPGWRGVDDRADAIEGDVMVRAAAYVRALAEAIDQGNAH